MGLRTKIAKALGYEKIRAPGRVINSLEAIRRVVGEPEVVFDVGAYDGRSARAFRKAWPGCTIHSFEPSPDNYAQLIRAADPAIKPVALALSDVPGTAQFHINKCGITNSLLPTENEAALQMVDVSVDTLDGYCEREGVEKIDLLKSDAQGADLRVLQGAAGLLERGAIRAIFTEVCVEPQYVGQARLSQLCSYLEGFGYRLFDFFDGHYSGDGHLRWADLLFYRTAQA